MMVALMVLVVLMILVLVLVTGCAKVLRLCKKKIVVASLLFEITKSFVAGWGNLSTNFFLIHKFWKREL